MDKPLIIEGFDNHKATRQAFADKIFAMDDAAFVKEAEHRIWLSAFSSNNSRSDYHWQADACYDEAERRGKPELYAAAWDRSAASAS